MWGDAMKIIEQWLPDMDFSRPAADEITGLLVPIPSTYGMSIDKATSVLEDAGFTVAVGGEIDSQLDRGLIAGSYPRSGDSTSSGDTVTIYPSDGSPYVKPTEEAQEEGRRRTGDGATARLTVTTAPGTERIAGRDRADSPRASVSRAGGAPRRPPCRRRPCP